MVKWIISCFLILGALAEPTTRRFVSTIERVIGHGYPLEEHNVQTGDGYILTIYRIPYSPRLKNKLVVNKPVTLTVHGFISSSDAWILGEPDNALGYMLADSGFDVWLGNARGNVYSRKHVSKSPSLPPFWKFDWHEIAIYDLPAMIDYILYHTGQDSLHYVGHSQGTTTFMVLLSEIPSFNKKIKTSHMLAPAGFMNHMQSPFAKTLAPFLGYPYLMANLIGNTEFFPSNKFINMLGPKICKENSFLLPICTNVIFLFGGWNSTHLDYSLVKAITETHPAGSSTFQLIHFLQEFKSGKFRQYDHGKTKNKKIYASKVPPDYIIKNIKPPTPINFFYSDNDYIVAVEDVHRIAAILGKNVKLFRVSYTDFNHLDFIWAIDVKDVINACIVDLIKKYEKLPFNGTLCKHFV